MENDNPFLKIVLVGDGAVGKTSLLFGMFNSVLGEDYIPPIESSFHIYSKNQNINGKMTKLWLYDTRGGDNKQYDIFRPRIYNDTDVFIVCFNIYDKMSLTNVTKKWIPEVRKQCANTPVLLVGTKLEKREKYPGICVDYIDGLTVAKQIEAYCYLECSAKTRYGVEQVFDDAIKAALLSK